MTMIDSLLGKGTGSLHGRHSCRTSEWSAPFSLGTSPPFKMCVTIACNWQNPKGWIPGFYIYYLQPWVLVFIPPRVVHCVNRVWVGVRVSVPVDGLGREEPLL